MENVLIKINIVMHLTHLEYVQNALQTIILIIIKTSVLKNKLDVFIIVSGNAINAINHFTLTEIDVKLMDV
jgi:hypothetical protein